MSLQDFINQYQGQPNVGDTLQNTGQCVGLVEVWSDSLGEPHTWGNAADLMTNADQGAFDVIYNTPEGVPSPGDIFCFDGYYGGGAGHTGIVVSADTNTVNLFQQNDPDGSTPHVKAYSYDHAIGWLHPHALNQPTPQPINASQGGDEPMNADEERQAYEGVLGREPEFTPPDGRSWKEFTLGAIPELQARRESAANQLADLTEVNKNLRDTVTALNDANTKLEAEQGSLQEQLNQAQQPVVVAPSAAPVELQPGASAIVPKVDSLSKHNKVIVSEVVDNLERIAEKYTGTDVSSEVRLFETTVGRQILVAVAFGLTYAGAWFSGLHVNPNMAAFVQLAVQLTTFLKDYANTTIANLPQK